MIKVWSTDDHHDRWIYRTIYPVEVRSAEHRLIQFKNMEELDAEADWNFDDHLESGQPLTMSMMRTSKNFPMGLSFFSFANDHVNTIISTDLPSQAEIGEVFTIIVENNEAVVNTNAYHQVVTKGCQPKKIRNAAGEEVTLKTFICYKANSELLQAGSPFCCIYDNNSKNHRTVAPTEATTIGCVDCTINGRLAAEPITQPSLYAMLDFRMHCFRIRAAAAPKPLNPCYNRGVHRLACVLYRGFDTDCSEEDSKNIVAILRFLEQNDYQVSALKLLKKQYVIELLHTLFSNEYLDEEETKEVEACLAWMRNELEQLSVSSQEQVVNRPTKLQVAVRYDIECSNDAMDSINQSFEQHNISDASNIVPNYEVLVSTSCYRSVVDFACEYVPVHLIDFPVVDFNSQKLIPTDPIIVMEVIVNHDRLETNHRESQSDVVLVSPDNREVCVYNTGFLSNKHYWGSKWQCTAIARATSKRCCNKTHHSSGRCYLHRDPIQYLEPVDNMSISK